MWSKRHRDLGRSRTQVVCRLYAVLCELIPGGISKAITAGHAARVLDAIEPAGTVALARHQLAAEFLEDLRRIDTQMRQARNRLTAAVRASGTTLTRVYGVGPIIAATVLGAVTDVSRFASRDQFAAYNGTAPIEVSSDPPAVPAREPPPQPRHPHGRGHPDPLPRHPRPGLLRPQDRRRQDPKEALRALKRRVSDAIFTRLQADARRAARGARVRLLQAGDTNKNDPNDACSVAVAALRSTVKRPVLAEDYAVVLKVRAKRHRDLARVRNQAACRLHAVLCDLVPGGIRKEISAGQAARILEQVRPSDAVVKARCELAAEFLTDIRRLDAQLRELWAAGRSSAPSGAPGCRSG